MSNNTLHNRDYRLDMHIPAADRIHQLLGTKPPAEALTAKTGYHSSTVLQMRNHGMVTIPQTVVCTDFLHPEVDHRLIPRRP
jgi:hypothetical protein